MEQIQKKYKKLDDKLNILKISFHILILLQIPSSFFICFLLKKLFFKPGEITNIIYLLAIPIFFSFFKFIKREFLIFINNYLLKNFKEIGYVRIYQITLVGEKKYKGVFDRHLNLIIHTNLKLISNKSAYVPIEDIQNIKLNFKIHIKKRPK